jgi:hypothetical protein
MNALPLSLMAVALLFLSTIVAFAHQAPSGLWRYDPICCNNRDCSPIDQRHVTVVPNEGYLVTLDVGDHPLVRQRVETLIPFKDARPSGDGEYHACVLGSSTRVRCLYITGGV